MLTFAEAESRFPQVRGMRSSGQLDQAAYESALMPDWRVGDRLAKRRGEVSLRKL